MNSIFSNEPQLFEKEINDCTNESLNFEPYDLFFDLLDKIQSDLDRSLKLVLQQLHKKLSHRNAKVQILSLKVSATYFYTCLYAHFHLISFFIFIFSVSYTYS